MAHSTRHVRTGNTGADGCRVEQRALLQHWQVAATLRRAAPTEELTDRLATPHLTRLSAALYQGQPPPALYQQEESSPGPSLIAGWGGG